MKPDQTYPMTPFDLEITDDSLHMMKLFLPYLPPSYQRMLGVFIKVQELQHAVTVLSLPRKNIQSQSVHSPSLLSILEDISPYLPKEQAQTMEQAIQMIQMLTLAGQMKSQENSNPMEMLMNMMSPEDKEMFETYNTMFSDAVNDRKGGDNDHERMDESSGNGGAGSTQTRTD